jgi:hypothetical protein
VARDSSAELTSNDGFSVVAPMKVNSPDSTWGRKASCCALLKRCTSSTKTMQRRPCACVPAWARSTASRMSLTPPSTADICMNSASKASAISRASVVLPTPGGPHRIIECGRPDSKATRSGLPAPSRSPLADHLVERARAQALGQRHIHRRHRRHRLCRRGACRCLGRTAAAAAAAAARLRAAEQVVDHAQLTWAHHRQCFTFTA